jgi:hypothetical protein
LPAQCAGATVAWGQLVGGVKVLKGLGAVAGAGEQLGQL